MFDQILYFRFFFHFFSFFTVFSVRRFGSEPVGCVVGSVRKQTAFCIDEGGDTRLPDYKALAVALGEKAVTASPSLNRGIEKLAPSLNMFGKNDMGRGRGHF